MLHRSPPFPLGRRRLLAFCLSWVGLLAHAAPGPEAPAGSSKILHVVSDENYPPYVFLDADGRTQGYLVDYWQLWQRKTGVAVKFSPTRWSEALRQVQEGEADVVDLIYRTAPREPFYDYSPPYARLPVNIYSHASISGISNLDTLKGFQVGVQKGDACIDQLAEHGITSLLQYDNYEALVEAAGRSEVKIFCLDEAPAGFYLSRLGIAKDFRKDFEFYVGEPRRAVRKGNAEVLALVVRGMQAISKQEDDALRRKWFGTPLGQDKARILRQLELGGAIAIGIALLLGIWVWTTRRVVKRKTAELVESERRFRTLFEDTRQAIVLLEDGHFVAANRAALDMLHMERPEQLIGQTPDLISPAFQPDGSRSVDKAAEMSRIAQEQGFHQLEWVHRRADGETFTAQILLTVIQRDGKTLMHAVWNDITAQKQAERELAEYRQGLERQVAERTAELAAASESLRSTNGQLHAIVDSASTGILLIRDRVIVQCNRHSKEVTGYDRAELEGQPTRVFYFNDEDWLRSGAELYHQLGDGRTNRTEAQMKRKGGHPFWARLSAHAINPANLADGVVILVDDITAERATAEALRLSESEQQAILESASSGIVLLKDRIATRCNRRMHEILGWPDGGLIGQSTRLWYLDEQAFQQAGSAAYDEIWQGRTHQREQLMQRRDGSTVWTRMTGHAIDTNDPARGSVWIIDDISAEREAAQALRQANEKLGALFEAAPVGLLVRNHEDRLVAITDCP